MCIFKMHIQNMFEDFECKTQSVGNLGFKNWQWDGDQAAAKATHKYKSIICIEGKITKVL